MWSFNCGNYIANEHVVSSEEITEITESYFGAFHGLLNSSDVNEQFSESKVIGPRKLLQLCQVIFIYFWPQHLDLPVTSTEARMTARLAFQSDS